MTMLGCVAAAGLIMGMFFNTYALAALCLVIALAYVATMAHVGFGHASIQMISCLALLQLSYVVGLAASTFLHALRAATLSSSRYKNDGPSARS
jgi:hypothetical protein